MVKSKSLSESLFTVAKEGVDSADAFKRNMSLALLAEELDLINDPTIKSFVCAVLSRVDSFWISPASFIEGTHPIDEMKINGLILHTKRVVRTASLLLNTIEFSTNEADCLIAACLLHDCTKAIWHQDQISHDPLHMYTVDSFVSYCFREDAKEADASVNSVIDVSGDDLELILRLIRCSHGEWSPIPETVPQTLLERLIHISDLVAASIHIIIDGTDVQAERWNIPPII